MQIDQQLYDLISLRISLPDMADTRLSVDSKWNCFFRNLVELVKDGTLSLDDDEETVITAAKKHFSQTKPSKFGGIAGKCPSFTLIAMFDAKLPALERGLAKNIIRKVWQAEQNAKFQHQAYEYRFNASTRAFKLLFVDRKAHLESLPQGFAAETSLEILEAGHIADNKTRTALRLLEGASWGKDVDHRAGSERSSASQFVLTVDDELNAFVERKTLDKRRAFNDAAPAEDFAARQTRLPRTRATNRPSVERVLRQKGRQNAIKRHAQGLRVGHGTIGHPLIGRLVRLVLSKGEGNGDVASVCLSLMLLTGRDVSEIQKTRIWDRARPIDRAKSDLFLAENGQKLVLRAFRPPAAKAVDESFRRFVRPTAEFISLPVPEIFAAAFRSYIERQVAPDISKLFSMKSAQLENEAKWLLKHGALPRRHDLTLPKVRTYVARNLSANVRGRNLVSLMLGMELGGIATSQLYYRSVHHDQIVDLYKSHLKDWLGNLGMVACFEDMGHSQDKWVGSAVRSEVAAFRALGADIRSELHRLYSRRHLKNYYFEMHNLLTAYVFTAFQLCAGFRPFSSPISSFSDIDESTGLCRISDKKIDESHAMRLVWLPPDLIELIKLYERRAAYVTWKLNEFRSDLIVKDASPFFVTNVRKVVAKDEMPVGNDFTDGDLTTAINRFWNMPTNSPRHFLINFLSDQGVSEQVVNMYMGHWDAGQEPFSAPAMISGRDLVDAVKGPISDLWNGLDWQVPEGLLR